jgi:hypothetical protein
MYRDKKLIWRLRRRRNQVDWERFSGKELCHLEQYWFSVLAKLQLWLADNVFVQFTPAGWHGKRLDGPAITW